MNAMREAMAAEAERVSQRTDLGRAMTNTPIRKQINELQNEYRRQLNAVRQDAGLSDVGKAQALAQVWRSYSARISELNKLDYDTQVAKYDKLEAVLFGTTADSPESALSFRDAFDRANKITDQKDAMTALGSARLSGDTVLARAIVMRAWQANWREVIDAYAIGNPSVASQIAELNAIRDQLDSLVSKFGGSMNVSMRMPEELEGVPAALIDKADASLGVHALSAEAIDAGRRDGSITPAQAEEARLIAIERARNQ